MRPPCTYAVPSWRSPSLITNTSASGAAAAAARSSATTVWRHAWTSESMKRVREARDVSSAGSLCSRKPYSPRGASPRGEN
eukprot:7298735-Prymnesium_polylepis.1